MTDKDFYITIDGPKRTQIKEKNSKFIASVSPIKNKEDGHSFLEIIKSEFYDASHHCFSYKLGEEGLDIRYSDDGEPSGSAGKPILFAINKFKYTNVIVVVTRYYGGTKLGVGGLSRAYSDAAKQALEICIPSKVILTQKIKIFSTYEDISAVKSLISEYAVNFDEFYTDAVEILAEIPRSEVKLFEGKLTEATAARSGIMLM